MSRGLLGTDGNLTETGGAMRQAIEDQTDRLASPAIDHLEATLVNQVIEVTARASRSLIDSGIIPVPNPIGAPRPTI